MGTFVADGPAVLPNVKADARPATIPPAADEWTAANVNQIREALLDLRSFLQQKGLTDVLQIAGPGFALGVPRPTENVTVSDALTVAKA